MSEFPEVLSGSVIAQHVRCGRKNCCCKDGGAALHGEYFYHFYREDGRLKKRYLKPDEVEVTRQACERGKAQRERRAVWCKMQRLSLPSAYRDLWRDVEAKRREAMLSNAKHRIQKHDD